MFSRKESILSLVFVLLLGIPIFILIDLGTAVDTGNWEELERGLVNYLISIWSVWILTVSIAVYYKWTEKNNLYFFMNYSYLIVAFGFFIHYNATLLNNIELPQSYASNRLTFIRTAKHLMPILFATGYLQASVWWFSKKWHRK
ncbi:hypothetical protein [Zobellia alginiliquefaciens]|uniref:hypothetical protein n=1 Tax=Zobellia alginiliquefaciens TaxID=3032586 RepID=UPI0023E0C218|nr:hypothetical protein [Zobellia alginiliquefaciens]